MRWKIIVAAILFFTATTVFGQNNTAVTGTIVGSNTAPWANATAYAALNCPSNEQAYIGTFPIPMNSPTTKFDANGNFSQVLYNTSVLRNVNGGVLTCSYKYHITDQCGTNSFISNALTGITGSGPVDLSTQINATAPAPCVPGGGSGTAAPPPFSLQYNLASTFAGANYLYKGNDTSVAFCASIPCASISANTGLGLYSNSGGLEILATSLIGGNVTSSALTVGNCVQAGTGGILTSSSGPCSAGGGGTVSSFSAGNFSPLFNTSVSNPTTTPALSFSTINQGTNTFYAGPNGFTGAPSFRLMNGADLPASTNNCTGGQFAIGINFGGTMNCATPSAYTNWASTTALCSTTNSAGNSCSTTISLHNTEVDTSYRVACSGVGSVTGFPAIFYVEKTTTTVTVHIINGEASMAQISSYGEVDCVITR